MFGVVLFCCFFFKSNYLQRNKQKPIPGSQEWDFPGQASSAAVPVGLVILRHQSLSALGVGGGASHLTGC